jgi:DUF4097 and DUF4098 domain-containing protein YvlB
MESRNRNVLIIVAVILAAICLCSVMVAVGVLSWFGTRAAESGTLDPGGRYRESVEQTFQVNDMPSLDISNFAGSVTIRPGESNTMHVAATKKAPSKGKLNRIEVTMTERDGGVVIKSRLSHTTSNASVDLEITAPADTRLSLDLGAGEVHVRGLNAPIVANSGAGSINVQDAWGPAQIQIGAGNIIYQGVPTGECRFLNGAGSVFLGLPADLNMEVDLRTGVGDINVGFYVDGRVKSREVKGVIGDGSGGSIYAQTGVGVISLRQR